MYLSNISISFSFFFFFFLTVGSGETAYFTCLYICFLLFSTTSGLNDYFDLRIILRDLFSWGYLGWFIYYLSILSYFRRFLSCWLLSSLPELCPLLYSFWVKVRVNCSKNSYQICVVFLLLLAIVKVLTSQLIYYCYIFVHIIFMHMIFSHIINFFFIHVLITSVKNRHITVYKCLKI